MMPNDDVPKPLASANTIARTLGRMVRREWRLAKAEISQNLSQASLGAALFVGAFAFGLVAVFVMSGAAVAGLAATGIALWLAALIVGALLAAIATLCAAIALSKLKAERLIPDRTLANVQRDMEIVKEALNA